MRERPILFSAPMVRAILDGRKTQTRRVLKTQPIPNPYAPGKHWVSNKAVQAMIDVEDFLQGPDTSVPGCFCPYGKPGDRLWVKETWGYHGTRSSYPKNTHRAYVAYHADGTTREVTFQSSQAMHLAMPKQNIRFPHGFDDLDCDEKRFVHGDLLSAWWERKKRIVSIHMPRWASRITLEVTGVRVERLQEISEADALAEGVEAPHVKEGWCGQPYLSKASNAYRELWNAINGAGAWGANPWVWVVEFRRAQP
jgi:hypothetical protein